MGRRARQLLPETSLHLPSSGCRLKWSNIPYPQLACLCFPKEMRHLQSRCSSALPSPSHNNPEREEQGYGGWKGSKAPAVPQPLAWAESGRSRFWMCQFARQDGTEELWLVEQEDTAQGIAFVPGRRVMQQSKATHQAPAWLNQCGNPKHPSGYPG